MSTDKMSKTRALMRELMLALDEDGFRPAGLILCARSCDNDRVLIADVIRDDVSFIENVTGQALPFTQMLYEDARAAIDKVIQKFKSVAS